MMKTKDINEDKRYELWKKIVEIENKDEDFLSLKKNYKEKITDFCSEIHNLNFSINNQLYFSSGSSLTIDTIESENQELKHRMEQYAAQELDDLEKKTKKARELLDKDREKLIKERTSLPWE